MAKTIYNGFHSYFADFQNLTLGAKARFEKAHWHAVQH
ncbi:MAG: bifunctional isocitrate dehydrogenase kinase/phosphatase, partial [Pseudomonadales bacterium]|nr:bifunctional isocitrate dehydrogenase kinase/phosphatase [Pseudomonadales bacterium]